MFGIFDEILKYVSIRIPVIRIRGNTMESLQGFVDVLAKEWERLPGFAKIWSILVTILEILILIPLRNEVTTILNQRYSSQGQIAFLLVIIAVPAFSALLSGMVIFVNSKIRKPQLPSSKYLTPPSLHVPTRNLDLQSLQITGLISRTDYSLIETCVIDGEQYVLKRTRKELCQARIVKKLVRKELDAQGSDISMIVATPLEAWVDDEYMWELLPYYKGISLYHLISRSRFGIQGDLLGVIYSRLLSCVSQLHEMDILHRDITPSNILLTSDYNLVLMDCTFCCHKKSQQIPIGNTAYTAHEQLDGKAIMQSDWYSIAATIYFLANREPPPWHNPHQYKAGLQKIQTGRYKSPIPFETELGRFYSVAGLIQLLLDEDVNKRPSEIWQIKLLADTAPISWGKFTGVLDLDEFGYLFTEVYGFHLVKSENVSDFLKQVGYNAYNSSLEDEVKQEIERLIKRRAG